MLCPGHMSLRAFLKHVLSRVPPPPPRETSGHPPDSRNTKGVIDCCYYSKRPETHSTQLQHKRTSRAAGVRQLPRACDQ